MEGLPSVGVLQDVWVSISDGVTALLSSVGRPLGLLLVFPVFVRGQFGALVRSALALVLVVPIAPSLITEMQALRLEQADAGATAASFTFAVLLMKEMALGALLGVIMGLPFWAISAVGEIVDTQRGVTNSDVEDPATKASGSVTGLFVGFVSVAVFISSGGLLSVADALYRSYAVWPLTSLEMRFSVAGLMLVAGWIDYIFRFAVSLGGPLLILLLLADIALGFLSRAAPQIVTQDVAPMIKNVIYTLFLVVYGLFFFTYMADELARVGRAPDMLEALIMGTDDDGTRSPRAAPDPSPDTAWQTF